MYVATVSEGMTSEREENGQCSANSDTRPGAKGLLIFVRGKSLLKMDEIDKVWSCALTGLELNGIWFGYAQSYGGPEVGSEGSHGSRGPGVPGIQGSQRSWDPGAPAG